MKTEKLFCISLETGAFVIAGVSMFFQTISLITTSIAFSYKEEIIEAIVNSSTNASEISTTDLRSILTLYFDVFATVLIVGAIFGLCCDICLVLGTIKKKHLLLLPWLIFFGIGVGVLVLESFAVCLFGIFSLVTLNFSAFGRMLPSILIILAFTAFYGYIWIAMKSLYSKIKSSGNGRQWNEKEFVYRAP